VAGRHQAVWREGPDLPDALRLSRVLGSTAS
jgi:hypothetical protein